MIIDKEMNGYEYRKRRKREMNDLIEYEQGTILDQKELEC